MKEIIMNILYRRIMKNTVCILQREERNSIPKKRYRVMCNAYVPHISKELEYLQ